ncbi:hypothetical protein CDD81_1992 [Ophiocordyceps australis]|uniref:F-box domain-containing protein n=1 Tax=Ophiocordyceps australis TaxID=1399860 RepID=A0A2C5YA19_9HYPO|nr:hypothetical protein CDD81_1992 [Ophiocordyceps australis]
MEETITQGRNALHLGSLRKACKFFTSAINLCRCMRNGHEQSEPCFIGWDVVAASSELDNDEGLSSLARRPNPNCSTELHLQALYYRSFCYSMLKRCQAARRDAETMVGIAPQAPQSFLRLGQIMSSQDNPQAAHQIFRVGIRVCRHVTGERAQAHIERLNALCGNPRVIRGRADPFQLPGDLIFMIFAYMEVRTLLCCLRVSRTWKSLLEHIDFAPLWKCLILSRPVKGLRSTGGLGSFSQKVSHSLRIVNLGSKVFQLRVPLSCFPGISLPQDAQIPHYPKLELLTVLGAGNEPITEDRVFPISPRQEYLLQDFVARAADTLVHLDLPLLPITWSWSQGPQIIPQFPMLKHLRILSPTNNATPLLRLAMNTPLLQHLTLNRVYFAFAHVDLHIWTQNAHELWNHLETLNIGFDTNSELPIKRELIHSFLTLVARTCKDTIRHVCLNTKDYRQTETLNDLYLNFGAFEWPDPDILDNVSDCHFGQIKTLRFAGPVFSPSDTQAFLRQALDDGTLETFEITLPLNRLDDRYGHDARQFLRDYDWLKDLRTLRSLSLLKINFDLDNYDGSNCPLTQFICSLRNLDTLCLQGLIRARRFCDIMTQVFMKTRLGTVYTDSFSGTDYDLVASQAQLLGVKLKVGLLPRPWPEEVYF